MMGAAHTFTARAMELMQAYDWPGNVRELKNAVERGVILNSDTRIDVDHLPSPIQNFYRAAEIENLATALNDADESVPVFSVRPPAGVIPLPETERRAIMEALGFTRGDRGKAARLLQISRTTLYRKLKEYQIDD
jgi:DNA-binding NtrC family response regulator